MKYTDVAKFIKTAGYLTPEEREAILEDKSYGQATAMDATGRRYVKFDPYSYADYSQRKWEADASRAYDSYKKWKDQENKHKPINERDSVQTYEEWITDPKHGWALEDAYGDALKDALKYENYEAPYHSYQDLLNYSPEEARKRVEDWSEARLKMPFSVYDAIYPEDDMKPGYDRYGTDPDEIDDSAAWNVNRHMASGMPIETPEDIENLYHWLRQYPVSDEFEPRMSGPDDDFDAFKSKVQDYMQRNVYDHLPKPIDPNKITTESGVQGGMRYINAYNNRASMNNNYAWDMMPGTNQKRIIARNTEGELPLAQTETFMRKVPHVKKVTYPQVQAQRQTNQQPQVTYNQYKQNMQQVMP